MKSITFNICWLSKDLGITGVKVGHLKAIFHSMRLKRVFLFFSTKYVIITEIFLTNSFMLVPVSEISGVSVWFEEFVSGWEGGETHGLTCYQELQHVTGHLISSLTSEPGHITATFHVKRSSPALTWGNKTGTENWDFWDKNWQLTINQYFIILKAE